SFAQLGDRQHGGSLRPSPVAKRACLRRQRIRSRLPGSSVDGVEALGDPFMTHPQRLQRLCAEAPGGVEAIEASAQQASERAAKLPWPAAAPVVGEDAIAGK